MGTPNVVKDLPMPKPDPERDRRALALHLAGATYDQVAKAVGFAHRPAALKAVRRALSQARTTVDLREAAETELMRLDAMLTGLWTKAHRGEPEAVDRVLRISRRQEELRDLLAKAPPPTKDTATGLSEFERRMQERTRRTESRTPPGSS